MENKIKHINMVLQNFGRSKKLVMLINDIIITVLSLINILLTNDNRVLAAL